MAVFVGCGAALLLCSAFHWPGRATRLENELRSDDPGQRRQVVRLLAHIDEPEAHEQLLGALEDDDPAVRMEAAAAVGRAGVLGAVPILLDWLDEPTPEMRISALNALGALEAARARDAIVRALGDRQAPVRDAAVRALGELGGPQAVEPLLRLLDEPDTSVRNTVILTLGELGDKRAVAPLLAQDHRDTPELLLATLQALEGIGDARAVPTLVAALQSEQQSLRLFACRALGALGDPQALAPLTSALQSEDHATADAALVALSGISSPEVVEVAIGLLDHPSRHAGAVRLLVKVAEHEASQAALAPVDKPEVPVDKPEVPVDKLSAASDAPPLYKPGSRTNAPPLYKPGSRRDAPAQGHASAVVAALGAALNADREPTAIDQLARAASAVTHVTSTQALAPVLLARIKTHPSVALLRALAHSGSPDALLPILEHLELAERDGWDQHVTTLVTYFDRAEPNALAVDPLLSLLERGTPTVRVQVVELLGRLGAQRVLPSLRPLLDHIDPALQLAAIDALGALSDSRAAEALLAHLDHASPLVRQAAATALGTAATIRTMRGLWKLLGGQNEDSQYAALRALHAALPRLTTEGVVTQRFEGRLLALLAKLLDHPDARLSMAAFDVLEAWHPMHGLKPLALLARHPDAGRRARAMQILGSYPSEQSRPALRFGLRWAGPRAVLGAVAGLAQAGNQSDLAALLQLARRKHWPIPAAVAFTIARMAERRVLKPYAAQRGLCQMGTRREPYVRANLAAAMAHLQAGPCRNGPNPLDWLQPRQATPVRLAAARWAVAALRAGRLPRQRALEALETCRRRDPDPQVAQACSGVERRATAHQSEPVDLFAYDPQGHVLLRNRLVALRFHDGSAHVGYTDANGHVLLPAAPAGTITLEDPGALPLSPPTLESQASSVDAPADQVDTKTPNPSS